MKQLCGDGMRMEWEFCGDGSKSRWGWVGLEIKSAGTGGDGCNFCPCAGLYTRYVRRLLLVRLAFDAI